MFKATPDDRDAMLLDLRGALRTVPPALWRNLAKRRQPADDQAEGTVNLMIEPTGSYTGLLRAAAMRQPWHP